MAKITRKNAEMSIALGDSNIYVLLKMKLSGRRSVSRMYFNTRDSALAMYEKVCKESKDCFVGIAMYSPKLKNVKKIKANYKNWPTAD